MTSPEPRPRVEGEAWAPRMPSSVVQDEINFCDHKLDRIDRDEVDLRTYLYICQDWRDLQVRLTRLTAEVERLTKALVKVRAHTAHTKASPDELHIGLLASIERIADAALSLPTPAPEATE